MIRVIIADDIPVLRMGLETVLAQDKDIEVVGTAGDGKEAFELCARLRPDVAIMDMRMPGFDGAYGTRQIKENCPEVKVLVLTTFDDAETVRAAMESGADGYILKEMDNEKIISSIKVVSGGMNVFCANIFTSMKTTMNTPSSSSISDDLNERELDMLRLIAQGYDNKEIAQKLFLSEGTVRNNISKLLSKLKLKDRTQLAVYAVKNNIM